MSVDAAPPRSRVLHDVQPQLRTSSVSSIRKTEKRTPSINVERLEVTVQSPLQKARVENSDNDG